MPLEDHGLQSQPFHEQGRPSTFVRYRSQQDAFRFLEDTIIDDRGIGLLSGPPSSGKSVLVRQFARELEVNAAVAVVDGTGLYASQLLSKILRQFGYEVSLTSSDDLLNMLTVFLVQQTRARHAPLLVVDNVQAMYPGALNALCRLAQVTARGRHALRIILVATGDVQNILGSASLKPIADRLVGEFMLKSMTSTESRQYLHEKLRTVGAQHPDDVFPMDVCDRLHMVSGGWPGSIDKVAMGELEKPGSAVADDKPPRLIVTKNRETLLDIELVATRLLIGRSELCDVIVNDQFVSKQHALLVWNDDAVVLFDLNSSNGTFVNSRRIKTQIMRNHDVIALGDHRIKLDYKKAGVRTDFEDADLADTARMKNIADARRAKAIRSLPLRIVQNS